MIGESSINQWLILHSFIRFSFSVGGLAFEYYIRNNSGFLAYLIVPTGDRGERMATALIDYAVETINFEVRPKTGGI